jgi:hypothetical protein
MAILPVIVSASTLDSNDDVSSRTHHYRSTRLIGFSERDVHSILSMLLCVDWNVEDGTLALDTRPNLMCVLPCHMNRDSIDVDRSKILVVGTCGRLSRRCRTSFAVRKSSLQREPLEHLRVWIANLFPTPVSDRRAGNVTDYQS